MSYHNASEGRGSLFTQLTRQIVRKSDDGEWCYRLEGSGPLTGPEKKELFNRSDRVWLDSRATPLNGRCLFSLVSLSVTIHEDVITRFRFGVKRQFYLSFFHPTDGANLGGPTRKEILAPEHSNKLPLDGEPILAHESLGVRIDLFQNVQEYGLTR